LGIVLGIIFALWFYDLFRLRSMLDTTTVEMTSSASWWSRAGIWDEEWECYLNSDKEAEQVIYLLNVFTASYQTDALTYRQATAKSASAYKKAQRVRRRSSKTSRELMMTHANPMNPPPSPSMELPDAPVNVLSHTNPMQPPPPPMDLPGAPPSNIEIHTDVATGKRYSVDSLTNESKWLEDEKKPPAPLQIEVDVASGRRYSYNAETQETKWM
jgi:hypothetical protein